jgi:hypothetical protein
MLYGGREPVAGVTPSLDGAIAVPRAVGVLAPCLWANANLPLDVGIDGTAESWFARTECVAECREGATLTVRLRFLQAQRRAVERHIDDTGFVAVEPLDVDGLVLHSGDEAVPHERDVTVDVARLLRGEVAVELAAPSTLETQLVREAGGLVAGRIRRRCWPLRIKLRLVAMTTGGLTPMLRLRVVVENITSPIAVDAPPLIARLQSMLSTHVFLALTNGEFVSLLEPPKRAAEAVSACTNIHTFPVLAGGVGRSDLMLSAPVPLLQDRPFGRLEPLDGLLDVAIDVPHRGHARHPRVAATLMA